MNEITIREREEIIDIVEECYIMGLTRPYQILKVLEKQDPPIRIDWRTAGRYLDIARKRTNKRFSKIKLDNVLKKDLRDLELMEKRMWKTLTGSKKALEKSASANTILKCKERRAKLLGLDTENINRGMARTLEDLLREDDEKQTLIDKQNNANKNEQGVDRKTLQNSGQAGN